MKTSSSVLPDREPSVFQEAKAAWEQRDFQKTIELLTRASRQQPSNSKILLNLAEAYGLRFLYQEAEKCLESAVAVASNKVGILGEAGRRCLRFGQPAMGNCYFARAAEHPSVSPWVLVHLAEYEEGHSRLGKALAFVDRALAMQPDHAGALVVRARLHRASGELEAGEKILRQMVAILGGRNSPEAWYELGTNLDRQGLYDQAMESFLQAKALLRPTSAAYGAELKRIYAGFREVEKSVSTTTLKRWVAAADELQPGRRFALLCGHPRSGTTLLEHVLDAHPAILATDETSILFGEAYPVLSTAFPENMPVAEILESASPHALQKARAEYFHLTELFCGQTIGSRWLIDKNPALDVHIPIVVRIIPEAMFLVALRDPRDVCLSCFMLPLPPGQLSALYISLEETVTHYVSVMGFSRAIRSKLPSSQLEVRYEELVADLEGVSRRVLGFLGVEWSPTVLRFDEHAKTRHLRTGIDDAVARPIFTNSVGRWRNYQKHLEPYLEQLKPLIKAFGYD